MPSVDQLKSRLEALLSKIGADGLARERKQIARAGSQTELRLLSTGLREILSKRFGERWSSEVDAVFGRSTTIQDAPPSMPPSTMPPTLPPALPPGDHGPSSDIGVHAPSRFGTQETYAAIKQQAPGERIESMRAYLIHAAQELLADKSAPMEERIANARSLNELRGVVRAMTEIARLTHSEVTVERFSSKVQALFMAVEAGPTQH